MTSCHESRALFMFGLASLACLAGCVSVEVPRFVPEGEELVCTRTGIRSGSCSLAGDTAFPDGTRTLRLAGQPLDLARGGLASAGVHVCVFSATRGFDCINTDDGKRLAPEESERISDRRWVAWDDGWCAEVEREGGYSRFECVQGGSIEERLSFWTSSSLRTVSFGRGACICGLQDRGTNMVPAPLTVGAVCVSGWGREPLDWDTRRAVHERASVVTVRGPLGSESFDDVCARMEGIDPDQALEQLEAFVPQGVPIDVE